MRKFTITMTSVLLLGVVILSACNGAKKNSQNTETTSEKTTAKDNSPQGYRMPMASTNDYCGNFQGSRVNYGYLMPEKGLFLKMNDFGGGSYGIDIYTYVIEDGNIVYTPGHFVNITPRGGDKIEITTRKRSKDNTPSFVFVPTPGCEYSDYVATEHVANSYFYLCGDGEARYKFEDLFEDERYAEFKKLVDNYKNQDI